MVTPRSAFLLSVVGLLGLSYADVLELTPETWDQYMGQGKPALVKFYAKWCGHCKNMAPDWETLYSTFPASDGVVIAKFDADVHRDFASKFNIKGFPTLKWFPAGSTTPEDYSGGRTAADLVSFVNSKMGLNRKVKSAPSAVVELTSSDFDAILSDNSKFRLVEFYASWCGHCKSLAPTYEKVAAAYEAEPGVLIAKIDADKHREIGERFNVQGFPTIKYIPAGSTGRLEDSFKDYEGGRDGLDFVEFINEKAGTARKLDGGLDASAGRIRDWDEKARAFMAETDAEKRAALVKEYEADLSWLNAADRQKATLYIKVMQKILEKGTAYVAKEVERSSSLATSEGISKAKRTEFAIRSNVLKAFF